MKIRSHKERVKAAKEFIALRGIPVSIFDREAFVEYFLLEDIQNYYRQKLEEQKKFRPVNKAEVRANKLLLERFSAVVLVFERAVAYAGAAIQSGQYSLVWSSIPEGALQRAAASAKYLPELRKLAVKMLRALSDQALLATAERISVDEESEDIDAHEANVRRVRGLPSADDILAEIEGADVAADTEADLPTAEELEEAIKAIERAIPDRKKRSKADLS